MIRNLIRLSAADLAFAAGLFVLSILIVWTFHYSNYAKLAGLRDRLIERRGIQRHLEEMQGQVELAGKDTDALEGQLAAYQATLVGSAGDDRYLEALTQALDRCNVQGESIIPGKPMEQDRFEITPIEVVTSAGFAENLCLIHELESRIRTARIVEFQLQAEAGEEDCQMTLNVHFYTNRNHGDVGDFSDG